MKSKFRRKDNIVYLALVLMLVYGAVAAAGWAGWLERPENIYGDLWHQLAGVRYQPQHVVIVSLDDETLAGHPDDPLVCFTPHFARVIQVLRAVGARAIGLDYLYYVSIESWLKKLGLPESDRPDYDGPFKTQLASGEVVMAGVRVTGAGKKKQMQLPLPGYFLSLPRQKLDVGLVNFYNDADGAVRRFVPALADDAGEVLLTFDKLLALRARGQDPAGELARLGRDPVLKDWSADEETPAHPEVFPVIGFVGPPDTFPRISFGRLLRPGGEQDPEVQKLRGKIAIIAYEPSALQDVHATPYSLGFWKWPGTDMSGPEVHANIIETLLTGLAPRPVPGYVSRLYLAIVLLAAGLLFYRLAWWRGLAVAGGICVLSAAVAYICFRHYWLIPTAGVQLAVILSYMGILGLKLTGEERERARVRKIFGRYVADEVVEKLLASGQVPDLGGEAFQVTVLFSDIRNFTTISEALPPGRVVEMLNTYLSRACEPVLAEGGTVDKFIGDAVMAVFGSPAAYPDHARRAINAALGLAEKAREFRTWMQEHFGGRGLPDFAIGIGIHTGEAIVGNIGSPKRLEFTAIGDTVNTASRLESLTKKLGWTIVASSSTIEAAPGVVTGRVEVHQVKGRQEPIKVFEVLGFRDKEI